MSVVCCGRGSSVDKAILVGNLGRDPEVRSMQNGNRVANLAVATSESWRDRVSGERKERTEWHRVVIFNERLAEISEKYLKKARRSTCNVLLLRNGTVAAEIIQI